MSVATPAAVRKQIRAGATDPLYLVQGDDEVEKSALAAEFAELVDEGLRAFNVERIHAGDFTTGDRLAAGIDTLIDASRTLPMMAPRRVVVVLQAENMLAPRRESDAASRALERLEDLFKSPEPQTTLVLVAGALDKRSRLYKMLAKQATLVQCGVIEDEADAEQWVRSRVAAAGSQIEPAAARLLAQRAGADVKRLRSEVDRLLLYALGQKTITIADARELAGPAALQDHWAMTNAIEAGAAPEALKQLALVLDAGAAPEQVLGQIGWMVRTKFPQLAPGRLAASVDAVFRTDLELKRTNRSSDQPRILLERLVVELCAGRRAGARDPGGTRDAGGARGFSRA
ncbi:MAG: DNA polymerase III subunit delta [Betaproteobacteria bacterium]